MKSQRDIQSLPESDPGWPSVYLKQGECFVSDGSPAQVRTVLGSCVTVTLYCPVLNIGGITHSLLPFPLPGTPDTANLIGRYVNSSVRHVFNKMSARGVNPRNLEVKIFGGSQMFLPVPGKNINKTLNIGRRNVETALQVIGELGLTVTATDVGGTQGRKLLFFPHRGDVWIKKIQKTLGGKEAGNE